MNIEEMEQEQILKYIRKNRDVSESDICREIMLSRIKTSNAIRFLLGAKKIELHRVVGKSKLYKVIKRVMENDK